MLYFLSVGSLCRFFNLKMRVSIAIVVIVGLFACSQAVSVVEDLLRGAGKQLVNNLVEQGKKSLLDFFSKLPGVDKLLGGFGIGKRDLNGLLEKFKQLREKGRILLDLAKAKAEALFDGSMDKLKELFGKTQAKVGVLKDAEEFKKDVDTVIADHGEKHKRVVNQLLGNVNGLFGNLVETLQGFFSSLKNTAQQTLGTVIKKGADLLGKRATLSDHLQTIGNALSSAVSPFKDIVAGLGNSLKGHFSNLVDTVKGHASALKTKLSGHVDDLKQHGSTLLEHGKNALTALSEVASDILKQTLSNAQSSIDGVAKTAANAGQTVLDHFTGGNSF
ncbi:hypothetical protein EB796_007172 [Bugula neritina]|uniref:Uncharacterized protein n=1 Tax=Bugula neritina TaxID=10212 RepID=A0A7J7K7B7_BUGNE|nr:hypothetical protein EB796_007172 [Bugula neritina]